MSKILIVDDEIVITEELQICLTGLGYQVVGSARTGEEAIEMARLHNPDLILMDILMPGKFDGIAAAAVIKKELDIPVVFVTAHTDDHFIDRAKGIEPLGYITKPFLWREIKATVEIALSKRKAEKRLLESAAHYQSLIDHTQDGVAIIRGHKYVYANTRFAQILGFPSAQEILGQPFSVSEYPNGWELLTLLALKSQDGKSGITTFEARAKRHQDDIVPLEVSVKRITSKEEYLFLVFLRDLADQKQREENHLLAKKLEATGILAGGIAHDFNNLLAVILGYVNMAQMDLQPENPVSNLLSIVEQTTFQARELTQKYLTFSSGGAPIKKPVVLKSLILNSLEPFAGEEQIHFNLSLNDDNYKISADEGQIKQALRTILENAREAMPAGGDIDIAVDNLFIDKKIPHLSSFLLSGPYIKIKIVDHGVGIASENLDKIFDPYFSTKGRGTKKGMGLGLSIAHAIIQKHGGYIQVTSELGLSTTVEIYLPASDNEN